jgi:hypothetical protein
MDITMDDRRIKTPAQRAAQAAADPDRLLPDENPGTNVPEEARHWIEAYTELVGFKAKLLAAARGKLSELTEVDARREAVDTDMVLLNAEHERLQRRLNFWKQRGLALGGAIRS